MLAGDEPTLPVAGVAVRVAGGGAEDRGDTARLVIAHHPVVRNVGEDEEAPVAEPDRPLDPAGPLPQLLQVGIAKDKLAEAAVNGLQMAAEMIAHVVPHRPFPPSGLFSGAA